MISKLQEELHVWRESHWPGTSLLHRMAKLSEEVGEVARCLTRAAEGRAGGEPELLKAELADVFFALCGVASGAGLDLGEAVEEARVQHDTAQKQAQTALKAGVKNCHTCQLCIVGTWEDIGKRRYICQALSQDGTQEEAKQRVWEWVAKQEWDDEDMCPLDASPCPEWLGPTDL